MKYAFQVPFLSVSRVIYRSPVPVVLYSWAFKPVRWPFGYVTSAKQVTTYAEFKSSVANNKKFKLTTPVDVARSVLFVSPAAWAVNKSLCGLSFPIHLFELVAGFDHIVVQVALALLNMAEATLHLFDTREDFLDGDKRYATRS